MEFFFFFFFFFTYERSPLLAFELVLDIVCNDAAPRAYSYIVSSSNIILKLKKNCRCRALVIRKTSVNVARLLDESQGTWVSS
jgi:hypothetical protein